MNTNFNTQSIATAAVCVSGEEEKIKVFDLNHLKFTISMHH